MICDPAWGDNSRALGGGWNAGPAACGTEHEKQRAREIGNASESNVNEVAKPAATEAARAAPRCRSSSERAADLRDNRANLQAVKN